MRGLLALAVVACAPPVEDDRVDDTGPPPLPPAWIVDTVDPGDAPPVRVQQGPEIVCAAPELRETLGPLTPPHDDPDWTAQRFDATFRSLFGGGGVTVADLDDDGRRDILLGDPERPSLFLQQADGTFVDASERLPPVLKASAFTPADVDDDGDLDVFVAVYQDHNALWRNDGGATFTDITEDAGVAGFTERDGRSASGTFGDVDGDGVLDLVVANHGGLGGLAEQRPGPPLELYLGVGDGTFVDASDTLPEVAHLGHAFQVGLFDLDDDADLDLYVVHDYGHVRPNVLVWNTPDGWVADDGGLGLNVGVQGMGLGLGDLDGDGARDLVIAGWGSNRAMVLTDGVYVEQHLRLGLDGDRARDQIIGWGTVVADLDHDGDDDVVEGFGDVWNQGEPDDQPDEIFLQTDDGFTAVGQAWGFDHPGETRGLVVTDMDGDGWLDLLRNDLIGPATYQRSRCGDAHWVTVRLRQPAPNLRAVGASVLVRTGQTWRRRDLHAGGTSILAGAPVEAHVGLGSATRIDELAVRWPDGTVHLLEDLPVDRVLTLERTP